MYTSLNQWYDIMERTGCDWPLAMRLLKAAALAPPTEALVEQYVALCPAPEVVGRAMVGYRMDTLLKPWTGKSPPPVRLPRPTPGGSTKIFLVDKAAAPQSSIRIGLVGIERTNPDYHRALVMNQILGSSFKRLDLNLREQKGWTYGVRSIFEARRTPGPWISGGEFVAEHTAESVAEILREIRNLRDNDVTDTELGETKDEIIKAFPARFATVNQIASQMATLAVYGLPNNDLETFTRKIEAVTKADVRKMAMKYLLPEKMVIVVVGDRKTNEPLLRKIADVELRTVDGDAVAAPTALAE
jgi:predicted Zn-dependent peptidase